MIIITGAAGFIGTNLVKKLNNIGIDNLILVDNINTSNKWQHLIGVKFKEYIHKDELFQWLMENDQEIDLIIHMGACSNTMEYNFDYLIKNNYQYSKNLWDYCTDKIIPFIYASSAATYGKGEHGFSDKHDEIVKYKPINQYGYSKHIFDLWALRQNCTPKFWAGLKFFNVYGPFEDCKKNMASVAHTSINNLKYHNKINLFKSYNSDFEDGYQLRDFIYVSDVVDIILYLIEGNTKSGIYNVGTGKAKPFIEIAKSIINNTKKEINIDFIEMPEQLIDTYQYYTEANMTKLFKTGYPNTFTSIHDGVTKMMGIRNAG